MEFVNGRLRPTFRSIWFVGGGVVSGECLRLGLADEVRYSILPIVIGDGIPFFEKLDRDVPLHLMEVKAYKSGMVGLRYEVRGYGGDPQDRLTPPPLARFSRAKADRLCRAPQATLQGRAIYDWIPRVPRVPMTVTGPHYRPVD